MNISEITEKAVTKGFLFVRDLAKHGVLPQDFYRSCSAKGFQCFPSTRVRYSVDVPTIELERKEEEHWEGGIKLPPCRANITKCLHKEQCYLFSTGRCEI